MDGVKYGMAQRGELRRHEDKRGAGIGDETKRERTFAGSCEMALERVPSDGVEFVSTRDEEPGVESGKVLYSTVGL